MTLPSISVVVVTRDRPELLPDALEHVAAQRHAPLELCLADDGEVACDPASFPAALRGLRIVRSSCRQIAGSRNLAAALAGGDVLAFLDDDDRWSPDHLAGLAPAFADPTLELAFRDSVVVLERAQGGRRDDLARRVIAREWDDALMRHDDFIAPSTFAVRRTLFERLGGFDESFRFSEDWDFLMRAARYTRPRRVPGVTVEIRMRESGNASQDRGPERRDCLDRLALRHGLPHIEIKTFWEVAEPAARVSR